MIFSTLGSGSGGNCCYIESDGTAILVDAGFGPRTTAQRLKLIERELEAVSAIIITHEHSDHIHGAEKIARKYQIPIYLTSGTLEASRIQSRKTPVKIFPNNTSFRIGELEIHARRIIHDAADPACFVVEARDGTRVGIASDLGCVDQPVLRHLQGCDALLFESNHDLDMLRAGTYPWSLKRRIMSRHGHLSNDDAMAALQRMVGEELKTLCLIHLSEKNNHESIVRSMANAFLQSLGAPIDLQVARQDQPLTPIRVQRRVPIVRPSAPAQLSLF